MIKSVGAQGKRYNKWRNDYVRNLKDKYTCTVEFCQAHIEDGKGQLDHLLVRTGKFAHLKEDERNVRWTCGNHNNIESMGIEDRVEAIGEMWGLDAHLFALEQTEGMY
jgi:hypothetical protein